MTGKGNTALGLLAILLGMLVGLGVYTFGYARGSSYLTNDPTSCNNCHVMRAQFEGWQRSSHSAVAVCNDCHTPAGLAPKYLTKMLNGFQHSLAFTSGRYPDEIVITPRNHRVAGSACLKCHDDMTLAIRFPRHRDDGASCTTCHLNVGHVH